LHLLRVAAVRRLPDHEVAAEELAAAREPHDERVVGLAARGEGVDLDVAHRRAPFRVDEDRRGIEALREARLREPELALVDARVPAVEGAVAVEAREAVALRDDRG